MLPKLLNSFFGWKQVLRVFLVPTSVWRRFKVGVGTFGKAYFLKERKSVWQELYNKQRPTECRFSGTQGGETWGAGAQAAENQMWRKTIEHGLESSIKLSTKFDWAGTIFGCVGRGWSSQDCVAIEWVKMLFQKAKDVTYYEFKFLKYACNTCVANTCCTQSPVKYLIQMLSIHGQYRPGYPGPVGSIWRINL